MIIPDFFTGFTNFAANGDKNCYYGSHSGQFRLLPVQNASKPLFYINR